jgi:hypothetical protein
VSQGRAIVTGFRAARPAFKTVAKRIPQLRPPWFIFAFVVVELACQVALLFPTFSILRVFVRSAAFLASVGLLLPLRTGPKSHPSAPYALLGFAIMTLSIFNPDTNSLQGGIASTFLCVAVFGPIFWVTRIRIDVATLRKLFLIYWVFNSVSGLFGALQVYYPGRFDPIVSTALTDDMVRALHIQLADGTRVARPMGLTDYPGGAGMGAAISIVFAVAFLIDRPKPLFRILLLASIAVSSFTLYLCQVRSLLVMTIISLIALSLPFAYHRRAARYVWIAIPVVAIGIAAFTVAVSVGGDAVTGRMSSLTDNDAGTVYYAARGRQLEYGITNLLPQYPFGAGLARWGMMYAYFGDPYNSASRPIWAEIQWNGWILDGGAALALVFACALVVAFVTAFRLAVRIDDTPGRDVYKWATVMVGYTVGMIALTFNACPFSATMGVDCWVLGAAVFAAAEQLRTNVSAAGS